MSIVNVKVKYIRERGYDNLLEWMEDPNNVYVGRRGIVFIHGERFPKKDSIWANPYKIGKDGTREEVISKYKTYIKKKIEQKEIEVEQLRGKNLGCWCHPDPCHAQVLLDLFL